MDSGGGSDLLFDFAARIRMSRSLFSLADAGSLAANEAFPPQRSLGVDRFSPVG